jgi:hypothetical protein
MQMISVEDSNVHVVAVEGTSDDLDVPVEKACAVLNDRMDQLFEFDLSAIWVGSFFGVRSLRTWNTAGKNILAVSTQ